MHIVLVPPQHLFLEQLNIRCIRCTHEVLPLNFPEISDIDNFDIGV